ncbi:MAG: DUF4827 domain-containing protein [Bacteroides sp.]|nr:DUF4827 domain-containing protein [Bacteroides sp.]MBD5333311.1 DUF4827 domain-containing protein [Bacteroides sp.]
MKKIFSIILPLVVLALTAVSCEDSKSYAELLADENKVVNRFLVQHRVEESFPEDFEVGEDAPYYRVDESGDVYMQVLQRGNGNIPETGDLVYFRYTSYDLASYVVGGENHGSGNADNVGNSLPTFFLLDDYSVSESTQYGTGIQIPIKLLGFDSKVNIVLKSQAGPTAMMSYVIPFLYTVSYYAPAGLDE